jgi:phosphoenolpyruvate carboxylase
MSFTADAQLRLADMFLVSVEARYPKVGGLLRKKHALVNDPTVANNRAALDQQLAALLDGLDDETRVTLAEMDAKLVDVMLRARKFAGIVVVNAVDESVQTGDRFEEVIGRFCRLNLSAATVEGLLPFAFVWPSLTTHPTNPTSVQYTRAGLELDRLLAQPQASRHLIAKALGAIRDTSMEADVKNGVTMLRKDPDLESDELLLICQVIYNSVCHPWVMLRRALNKYGYRSVKMPKSMIDVNVWGAGDGDGNPNVTAQTLEHMTLKFRQAIRANYGRDLVLMLEELEQLQPGRHDNQDLASFASRKESVARAVQEFSDRISHEGGFRTYDELRAAAARLEEEFVASEIVPRLHHRTSPTARLFQELLIKVNTFGLRFVGIDVRHNSVDIMECYAAMEKALENKSAFATMTPAEQADMLRAKLDDENLLKAAMRLPENIEALELALGKNAVAARVFSRLRVMAKYPGMFRKLIIAETRSPANAIAALLLLRLAGNVVGQKGASVSIVPLFESREDLIAAPRTAHCLLTDSTFLKHVEAIGYVLLMIAKSDTTRLSGPGVTGCQETAVSQLLAMSTNSYGNFKVNVFIGGGDDQMRGGGRIVETPHTVMLGANRLGASTPTKVAMTIQGLQMQLVFGSTILAGHFIEAFASQQLLAVARVLQYHPYRSVPKLCNRLAADHDSRIFFAEAMNMYETIAGKPNGTPAEKQRRATIVEYFSHFPSSVIALTNKSSRPLSRKPNPDPLEGRAISLDQLSKHDGAYLTSTLGVAKALYYMNGQLRNGSPEGGANGAGMPPIRHAFLANKTFRDFVRMQSVVLFQKEFGVAWALRGGEPSKDERAKLLEDYLAAQKECRPATARQFLARIQLNDTIEAALLVEALTGKPQDPATTSLTMPLRVGWSAVAEAMEFRRRQSELAQITEVTACQAIKALLAAKAAQDSNQLAVAQRLAYFGYVGSNPKFSTPSFSLTMTDPQKEGHVLLNEASAQLRIVRPQWMLAPRASKL